MSLLVEACTADHASTPCSAGERGSWEAHKVDAAAARTKRSSFTLCLRMDCHMDPNGMSRVLAACQALSCSDTTSPVDLLTIWPRTASKSPFELPHQCRGLAALDPSISCPSALCRLLVPRTDLLRTLLHRTPELAAAAARHRAQGLAQKKGCSLGGYGCETVRKWCFSKFMECTKTGWKLSRALRWSHTCKKYAQMPWLRREKPHTKLEHRCYAGNPALCAPRLPPV